MTKKCGGDLVLCRMASRQAWSVRSAFALLLASCFAKRIAAPLLFATSSNGIVFGRYAYETRHLSVVGHPGADRSRHPVRSSLRHVLRLPQRPVDGGPWHLTRQPKTPVLPNGSAGVSLCAGSMPACHIPALGKSRCGEAYEQRRISPAAFFVKKDLFLIGIVFRKYA